MKKLFQTRFNDSGNCFPTAAACIMDLDSPEEAIQIQEHYDNPRWTSIWIRWLLSNGYITFPLTNHSDIKDEFYIVSGKSPRSENVYHVCIYQNGKLYHDPHPDGTGILTEEYFEIIEPIKH